MVRVINNNLWTPVPWGWGCGGHQCNGGNNWMQKMFGYQMLFGMMNNMSNMFRCYATPPQQQGGFYPGLYLGGGGGGAAMPQNYEEYLQQQQDAQDFAQLKASYSGFKFTNIGGEYQARLSSNPSVRFSGSTVLELMDEMNAYIDEHPEDFKSKPAKVETSNEETVDNTSTGDDNTTTGTEGAGAPATSGSASSSNRRFNLPQAPQGYEWKNYKNLSDKSGYANDMALDAVLDKLGLDKNDTNRQLLRDANPNGIKNDKVADVNKLTVLVKKQISGNNNPVGPKGWDNYGASNVTNKLSGVNTASAVVDKLLSGGFGGTVIPINFTIDPTKKKQLIKDIIANNPTIFNNDATGTLKQGANLSGIVVPYVRALQDTYKATIKTQGVGLVRAKNNPNDAKKIQTHMNTKSDAADAVVDQLAYIYKIPADKLTQQIRNRIRKDLIYLNPSCFAENGSKMSNFDINKLDYPNEATFKKYCGLSASSTSSSSRTYSTADSNYYRTGGMK